MNKKYFKSFLFLFLFCFLFLSFTSLVFAQSGGGGTSSGTSLDNPIGVDDPRDIIGNVIKAVLGIVGSLALLMFIYGGFLWVTSAGNDEKIKKGKDILLWASFGLAVIFMSYALVNFVIEAITSGG